MLVDEGLELLTEATCWHLLGEQQVGRVGLTVAALPVILPVNYAVVDHAVLFRTSPGSKLGAAASGAVVAFEVDDYDVAKRTGWSVLAIGKAEVVHDLDVTFKVLAAELEPWADGVRTHIVRIVPELLSGRRIVHQRRAAAHRPPAHPPPVPPPPGGS